MKLSRYKNSSPISYALGATLSYELLKTKPQLITRAFLRPSDKYGDDLQKILTEFKQRKIEIVESTKAFNILGAKSDCLLIAEFKKESQKLDPEAPHIILVNPSDAGNLGTIMRSASAFGYDNLAIITPAVDFQAPKSIRASMGAAFHLNIATFDSIKSYKQQFGKRPLFAFMLDRNAQNLAETSQPSTRAFSLVFGNEATGLPQEFATFCTPIFIPQSQNVDSLNLSVAASLALYTFRQI